MRRGPAEAAARLETTALAGFEKIKTQLTAASQLMEKASAEHLAEAARHDLEAIGHRNLADVADESGQRHIRILDRLEELFS